MYDSAPQPGHELETWRPALIVAALIALVVGALCYIGVTDLFLRPTWNKWTSRIPFDSEKWMEAEGEVLRQDMVEDLEANYSLGGKTVAEILALLGRPTEEFTGESFPNSQCDQVWEYRMGRARASSLGPNEARFVVGFREGRVQRTWQYAD